MVMVMMGLFLFLVALLFIILMGIILFLYLEGYFSNSPLGIVFPPVAGEEEELQKEYPDLKSLYVNWQKLKTDLVHQEWKWDKISRPTHPIRAFVYKFICPDRLQKKTILCDETKDEYEMCLKLLRNY